MSEFEELFTDLTADPEAVPERLRGARAAQKAALSALFRRTQPKRQRAAVIGGAIGRRDPHRADAGLRRFSWEGEP